MEPRKGLVLLIILGTLVIGCGDRHQRQFRLEKRQFAIVMKSKLRQFDKRAVELASQAGGDSLRTAEVEALRQSHGEFQTRVAAIDGATVIEWKEMKPAMEAEYYDLERRYYEIAGAIAAQAAREATADTLLTTGAPTVLADSTRSTRAE